MASNRYGEDAIRSPDTYILWWYFNITAAFQEAKHFLYPDTNFINNSKRQRQHSNTEHYVPVLCLFPFEKVDYYGQVL